MTYHEIEILKLPYSLSFKIFIFTRVGLTIYLYKIFQPYEMLTHSPLYTIFTYSVSKSLFSLWLYWESFAIYLYKILQSYEMLTHSPLYTIQAYAFQRVMPEIVTF